MEISFRLFRPPLRIDALAGAIDTDVQTEEEAEGEADEEGGQSVAFVFVAIESRREADCVFQSALLQPRNKWPLAWITHDRE